MQTTILEVQNMIYDNFGKGELVILTDNTESDP